MAPGSSNASSPSSQERIRELYSRSSRRPDLVLANSLAGFRHEELREMGRKFVDEFKLGEQYRDLFSKAAVLAQDNNSWRAQSRHLQLSETEQKLLSQEHDKLLKWHQPWQLYSMVALASMSAAVQGWDETAVNGANTLYKKPLGLGNDVDLYGLVNSAPYLCCVISCWLTDPLNRLLGRRGAIFVTCLISAAACLGQGFTQTWQQMFIARFLLGLGIGPKSATVPIYAAECAPAYIRGALVMMWQMWTAFGIMLGLAAGLAFYHVDSSLNWRLMIASPMVLPLIVCIHVYLCPESPRWYISKGAAHYPHAFKSLRTLRNCDLQAARDLFYIHYLLTAEKNLQAERNRFIELFSVPRNRRAVLASVGLMFLQQFCGVNVLAYYSTDILFKKRNVYNADVLLVSFGFGLINFLFALPAAYTIDTFGRRSLLLLTFPLMALFMLLTGLGFLNVNGKNNLAPVIVGMYLFAVAYSPGEGPVPFTYSSECYPLYVRTMGMALSTSVTWSFNFIVAMTWPPMSDPNGHSLTTTGAFGFYSAWNLVGFIFILLFVPETKGKTLEELDKIFEVTTTEHARYGILQAKAFIKAYIFRQPAAWPVLSCYSQEHSVRRPTYSSMLHRSGDEELEMSGFQSDEEIASVPATVHRPQLEGR